ncbi:MAG: hypothetical protein AB1744_10295, partial [Candidatus Zixiibacteriota bacterium]
FERLSFKQTFSRSPSRRRAALCSTRTKETSMSLYKIGNPVEFSFTQWMNNYPNSAHWADKERFFRFAKTVCRHNATKWKNTLFLRNRILERLPHFDQDFLESLLDLYANLIEFYKVLPLTGQFQHSDRKVRTGFYIKKYAKNGKILEKEVAIDAT